MDVQESQDAEDWADFDQTDHSCTMTDPEGMENNQEEMKKKSSKAGVSSNKAELRNAVISAQDVEIMTLIGRNSMTTSDVFAANKPVKKKASGSQGNMVNKLTQMANKGFLVDSYKNDVCRVGLHKGEQRRYWKVTALGRSAISMFESMSQFKSSDDPIQSRRCKKKTAPAKKKVGKKKTAKK